MSEYRKLVSSITETVVTIFLHINITGDRTNICIHMIKLSGKVYLKFQGSSINMGGEMGQNKTLGCITAISSVTLETAKHALRSPNRQIGQVTHIQMFTLDSRSEMDGKRSKNIS